MADSNSGELRLSIVVPVFRSAEILPRLIEETHTALCRAGFEGGYELVLVCDASPDNSWSIIRALAQNHGFVRGICLRRNVGQHNATMAGLHASTGAVVVIMDDDLQHPPVEIPKLLDEIDRGFDVCYTRYLSRRHPLWKRVGSRINDVVATILLEKPRDLYLSSFKALRREIVQEIIKYDGPYAYLDGLILDVTRSISSVEIEHRERASGNGNYNLRRSLSLWLKMATSFSVYPLRLMAIIGAILGLCSFLLVGYVVYSKIMGEVIQIGWTSLIATILFVGGAQLIGMGLIGEYLGRAYIKLNGKPQFVISQTTSLDSKSAIDLDIIN